MEKKLNLNWYIYNNEAQTEYRYCHNCGCKVEFKDSLKRRQNANGKNIFYYAIYKCPKGHSWNKQIAVFKAVSGLENVPEEVVQNESKYEKLSIAELMSCEFDQVNILLEEFEIKERLDKFLSSKITDVSRSEIVRLISEGFIKINNNTAKAKSVLKAKDKITLLLRNIKR
ncbi:S4 domain-containing protein [Clostridium oryzae]|uniref:S4 domain protein n=1 Tax=Clostridium oryzae TaxID=1450648 RepID=A0A1V4IEA9_9CLOT|nr:S4 domain-containing protein [Clostridium oryzae]OPJ58301.1 S4 domain protein [Clostridium oryzae]